MDEGKVEQRKREKKGKKAQEGRRRTRSAVSSLDELGVDTFATRDEEHR
jgi:hypothetical protein